MNQADENFNQTPQEMDQLLYQALKSEFNHGSPIQKAMCLSQALEDLTLWFKEDPSARLALRLLQDAEFGFSTDRSAQALARDPDLRPYPYAVLVKICAQALIQGFFLTGREFQVEKGRFRPTSKGLFHKILRHPGLEDFDYWIEIHTGKHLEPTQVLCSAQVRVSNRLIEFNRNARPINMNLFGLEQLGLPEIYDHAAKRLFEFVLTGLESGSVPWPWWCSESGGNANASMDEAIIPAFRFRPPTERKGLTFPRSPSN